MGTIALALLGVLALAAWIIFRTMGRKELEVLLYGPAFFAVFGPLFWVLPSMPMMLASERGLLAGLSMSLLIYMVGAAPALLAGLIYSAALLGFRNVFIRGGQRLWAKGGALGALAGGIATLALLQNGRMAVFGAASGAVCGSVLIRGAIKRLGEETVE